MASPAATPAPITRPKGQLLKWIGNKQRYALDISRYFPAKYRRYFEPFLGSGAVLGTLAPDRALASDASRPLLEIWQTLQKRPQQVIEWYADRHALLQRLGKVDGYERIKASYNKAPNGPDLLFLSRSCYGGVVRFRKADGFMSTPCGIHEPIAPESFAARAAEWHRRIAHVDFECLDFRESLDRAGKGDLVYCDPPYVDSQAILYGAQGFSLGELFERIEGCVARGARVALSIDGTKKSGKRVVPLNLPPGLFQRDLAILNGRSMLRRFQKSGAGLADEVVTERLLLTF